MAELGERRGWRHPVVLDAALAAGLALFGVVSLHVADGMARAADVPVPGFVSGVAATVALAAPLALRRRAPLAALLATTAAFVVHRLLEVPEGLVSGVVLFVAILSAGAYGGRHRTTVRVLSIVAVAGLIAWAVADDVELGVDQTLLRVFLIAVNLFYLAAAWVLGDMVRLRRARERELLERAELLERDRESRAREAVVQERLRIARELHDVVAHHVSVIGLHAGAGRRVLRTDPAGAEEAFGTIEGASRTAIGELHRLLGFLRQPEEVPQREPQPTLGRLDALVEQVRGGHLPVELEVGGTPRPLAPGVEVSAYRIVQEALTNALKHAGPGASARVSVQFRPEALEVVVEDDGRGASAPERPGGHGLIGMRERVALHGGQLKVGGRAGGGFSVRAWLPAPEVRV